jgi:ADP-ribose pyrophosphatase YjhB (NUDIX family)
VTRPVRPSSKAVVAEEDRALLIHLRHPRAGDFYELPGGGVRPGETLLDAVHRETIEETGYSVAVHELLWVRDYIAANHEHEYLHPPGHHGVEFMFRCTLTDAAIAEPHEADDYQVGVEWVTADQLGEIRLGPRALVPRLRAFLADRTVLKPTYMGDVS